MNEPALIRSLLKARTIAVVGLSDDPAKPSNYVSAYLKRQGYRILPVNPSLGSVLDETCHASLTDLPLKPDLVNVFRLPRSIPGIVDEMIALGLTSLWVQQGIVHLEAAARAEQAGIRVVMAAVSWSSTLAAAINEGALLARAEIGWRLHLIARVANP